MSCTIMWRAALRRLSWINQACRRAVDLFFLIYRPAEYRSHSQNYGILEASRPGARLVNICRNYM